MKEEILQNIQDPGQLEKLYRSNKSRFKREFETLYPQLHNSPLALFWHTRLGHDTDDVKWGTTKDLLPILLAVLAAGFISKFPAIFNISEDYYYPRNIGFIIFPVLSAYFAWKNRLSTSNIAIMVAGMLIGLVFINLLPSSERSDTLTLSCLHLVLFQWSILGFAYTGGGKAKSAARLSYLKFNGDLIVMTTLIVIAGGIMSGVTIGLFSLIGFNIENFYAENIIKSLLPAAPILGAYLTQSNPQLVGKVSPVIAKIFSPLVFIMLVIYLAAMVYSSKDPYNNREFLMIFNGLLVAVMAIIFFSVAESSDTAKNKAGTVMLFLLSLATIIVNCIALSAIVFRIAEWGITPNRAAVLGGNILILANLLLVTYHLYKVAFRGAHASVVGKTIAAYLPVYIIWTFIVTFLFPFLFGHQ